MPRPGLPAGARCLAGGFYVELKKQDIILICGLLAGSLLFGSALALGRTDGDTVVVRVSGEQVAEFSQNRNTVYCIEGAGGGVNALVIQDREVWLEDASCPDQLCVHQGHIRHVGESIICLPNEVVVAIEGKAEGSAAPDVVAS